MNELAIGGHLTDQAMWRNGGQTRRMWSKMDWISFHMEHHMIYAHLRHIMRMVEFIWYGARTIWHGFAQRVPLAWQDWWLARLPWLVKGGMDALDYAPSTLHKCTSLSSWLVWHQCGDNVLNGVIQNSLNVLLNCPLNDMINSWLIDPINEPTQCYPVGQVWQV